MPFTAILAHDLRVLAGSWLVRLWLGATVLLALLQMMANWQQIQSAPLVAILLFPYLIFPWSLVVMMLSVNPLSGSQSGVAADGILSRPVTRYAYLWAAWSARVVLVWSVFLLVMIPAITIVTLADRPAAEDQVTLYGIVAALGVVGLVLTFLVSVGFLLGTLLRNSLLAIVVLVFVWFPVNLVLNTFSLDAEEPAPDMDAALRDAIAFFGSLTGGGAAAAEPKPEGFFERENYQDFSLQRVLLGYGIPTLVAIMLATVSFCLRDV